MPRAIVGPGSRSKRSSSRDSSRRAPMPVRSVKAAPLQRLVLRRAGESAPQLVGVGLLRYAAAELALDAQREPQRLRARLTKLVVARNEAPRLVHLALLV